MQSPVVSPLSAFMAVVLANLGSVAASAAGSILSLAFVEKLTVIGRLMAVAIGFFTAVFTGPLVASIVHHNWPWIAPVDSGVHFLISLTAMGVLPVFLDWMRRMAGDPLAIFGVIFKSPEAGKPK